MILTRQQLAKFLAPKSRGRRHNRIVDFRTGRPRVKVRNYQGAKTVAATLRQGRALALNCGRTSVADLNRAEEMS